MTADWNLNGDVLCKISTHAHLGPHLTAEYSFQRYSTVNQMYSTASVDFSCLRQLKIRCGDQCSQEQSSRFENLVQPSSYACRLSCQTLHQGWNVCRTRNAQTGHLRTIRSCHCSLPLDSKIQIPVQTPGFLEDNTICSVFSFRGMKCDAFQPN